MKVQKHKIIFFILILISINIAYAGCSDGYCTINQEVYVYQQEPDCASGTCFYDGPSSRVTTTNDPGFSTIVDVMNTGSVGSTGSSFVDTQPSTPSTGGLKIGGQLTNDPDEIARAQAENIAANNLPSQDDIAASEQIMADLNLQPNNIESEQVFRYDSDPLVRNPIPGANELKQETLENIENSNRPGGLGVDIDGNSVEPTELDRRESYEFDNTPSLDDTQSDVITAPETVETEETPTEQPETVPIDIELVEEGEVVASDIVSPPIGDSPFNTDRDEDPFGFDEWEEGEEVAASTTEPTACEEGARKCSGGKITICKNGNFEDLDLCNGAGCFISESSGLPVCKNELVDTCSTPGLIGCFPGEVQSYKVCKAGPTGVNEFLTSFCPAGTFCAVLDSGECGSAAGCCFWDDRSATYKCHPIGESGEANTNRLCTGQINTRHREVDPGLMSLWERSSIGKKYNQFIDEKLNALFGMKKFDVAKLLCKSKKKHAESFGTTVGNLLNVLSLNNFNVHLDGAYSSLYENASLYTVSWTLKTNEVPTNLDSGNKKINGAVCSFDSECASNFCNREESYGSRGVGVCDGEQSTTKTSIKQAAIFLLGDMPMNYLKNIAAGKKLPASYGDVPLKFIEYQGSEIFAANFGEPSIGSVMFDDVYKWDYVCIWFIPTFIDNVPNTNNEIVRPGIIGCQPIVSKDIQEDIKAVETSNFADSRPLLGESEEQNNALVQSIDEIFEQLNAKGPKELIVRSSLGRVEKIPESQEFSSNTQFLVNGKYLSWSKVFDAGGNLRRTFSGDYPRAVLIQSPQNIKDIISNFFYFSVEGNEGVVRSTANIGFDVVDRETSVEEQELDIQVNSITQNSNNIDISYRYSITKIGANKPEQFVVELVCESAFNNGFLCPEQKVSARVINQVIGANSIYQNINEEIKITNTNHRYNAAVVYIDGEEAYKVEIVNSNSPLPSSCSMGEDKLVRC